MSYPRTLGTRRTVRAVQVGLSCYDCTMSTLRRLARGLAASAAFRRAEELEAANRQNFWLPLSKAQKLYLGGYMILRDYARGTFPPRYPDRQQAYENEKNYFANLAGTDLEANLEADLRKPYFFDELQYLRHFLMLCKALARCGVRPPQRIAELGAGTGWMCELLSMMKFRVVATSIGDDSMKHLALRRASVEKKGLRDAWEVHQCPMESAAATLRAAGVPPVDAVFVYEALHHAFDWRETFASAHDCLAPGGWFLICNEPNLIHTFVAYRAANLSRTHEIGLGGAAMRAHLRQVGFRRIVKLTHRLDLGIRPHWLAAQRG